MNAGGSSSWGFRACEQPQFVHMDTRASLDLQALYAPIQTEMQGLSCFLDKEFRAREPFILEILKHIARFRGKQIRPALLFLSGLLDGRTVTANHTAIAGVVELVHTATLVHDDILDDAELRRKVETVHQRWGERAAILIGDYIYSRAFHLSTRVPGMASVLSDTTHTICEGELLQIGCRFREIDESTYLDIIRKKTAILYAVACELGGRLSGLDRAMCGRLRKFGMALGLAFQIVDDCLDYTGQEALAGKTLGTDLRHGKMTLPLIYLMECLPENDRQSVRELLRGPVTVEDEAWIRTLMHQHGVGPQAQARADSFIRTAKLQLSDVIDADPAASGVRESFELVADYVLRRQR